jgi:DNA-binding CsgD family transcriptional regulator
MTAALTRAARRDVAHVKHVLAKLDARDRVQAVVFAYQAGLVTPSGD